ncbi:MAG TPA: DUF2865 domain-containing protein [Xanthobacteraceae bacterium]|nr:DUF2865 domain-containing protein [Xanthobacteraceae bacterium]
MLKSRQLSLVRAILIAGLGALAVAAVPAPAAAQSLFDFFFNGAHRPAPPPSATAYADPQADSYGINPSDPGPRVDTGPAVSYCVRLCDGRFFPIQRSAATPAEICNSFCPAAHTKIFSGGGIDHAVAHDGSRYADLSNAFVYRTRVVPGCSCNGKDAFGLVNMQAADDPTLHHGDVVATTDGFVAYSGSHKKSADFTPINSSSSGVSTELRRQLAQTRIAPVSAPAASAAVINSAASERGGDDRQAQLER